MNATVRTPLLALFALTVLLASAASAQTDLMLEILDSGGGRIRGEVTMAQYEDWIEVLAFSHGVSIPYGSNGLPSGPAQTGPMVVTTKLERSSVPLFRAQAQQQIFDDFTLDLLYVTQAGVTEPRYRYRLADARLMSVQENASPMNTTVTLSFTYSQVRIEDLDHGTIVDYTWNPFSASTEEQNAAAGLLLSSLPNPTQGPTEFRFTLPSDSDATLTLYDLRGHAVRTLHNGWTKSGDTAVWDGTDDRGADVAQGVYLVRLRTPERETTQRITLLR